MLKRTFAVVGIIVIIVGIAVGLYVLTGTSKKTLIFSPSQLLGATWLTYTQDNLEANTYRTLDPSRGYITTSEGESYTMLRAVWMSDRTTFDKSWKWTQQNLQRQDHLFSWLFGKNANGSYGILTAQSGNNSAADGDEDIALALVFAYARWQDPAYLTSARQIIDSIWTNEVVMIQGKPYLAADNLEKNSKLSYITVNPSYFAPEDYRIFAIVDPSHPWSKLVDNSYTVLGQSMDATLDKSKSADLPPDWVYIDKSTGALSAPQSATASTTTNYGFDAMRVPFRLALDYTWYGDQRDTNLLSKMSFLKYTWQSAHAIGETYAHDGSIVDPAQSASMYGTAIGYFMYEDPADGKVLYQSKLASLFSPDINTWSQQMSYYDSNWTWFGIALYSDLLPNLAASVPANGWPSS